MIRLVIIFVLQILILFLFWIRYLDELVAFLSSGLGTCLTIVFLIKSFRQFRVAEKVLSILISLLSVCCIGVMLYLTVLDNVAHL